MARRAQRGLSLVELMVGTAGLLFVAASTAQLLGTQLQENRALLAETRLSRELQQAADTVARELRRAGHWGDAAQGIRLGGLDAIDNPYAAVADDGSAFHYSRDALENHVVDDAERFGLRLRAGVLEMRLGGAGWQAATDATALRLTAFVLTPRTREIDLAGLCTRPCIGATCPRQRSRSVELLLQGQWPADTTVVRSVRTTIHLRNDAVTGACPT